MSYLEHFSGRSEPFEMEQLLALLGKRVQISFVLSCLIASPLIGQVTNKQDNSTLGFLEKLESFAFSLSKRAFAHKEVYSNFDGRKWVRRRPAQVNQVSDTSLPAANRYTLNGTILTFDMSAPVLNELNTGQLELYDVNNLWDFFFNYPEINTLRVTGPGGSMLAASQIGELIIRHDLATEAFGECVSACTMIFLAGSRRSIEGVRVLGFHRQFADPSTTRREYSEKREIMGWNDEFDYLRWMYDELTDENIRDIEFMSNQGLTLDFILKVKKTPSDNLWFPSFDELVTAGVITE